MNCAFAKEVLIGLNEDSVRARKLRVRSQTAVKTTSRLQIVTSAPLEKMVPDKKYEDFHGSTRNDMISLVTLPPYESTWHLAAKHKQSVFQTVEGSRRITSTEVRRLNIILMQTLETPLG